MAGAWPLVAVAFLGAVAALTGLGEEADALAIIDPAGPLAEIHVSRVLPLDCQVMHADVDYEADGAESDGEFWGNADPEHTNACGTFLHFGGNTYGPNVGGFSWPSNPGNPVPIGYEEESQGLSGTGTLADPWVLETIVHAGASVTIRQTDTYASGGALYTTGVEVTNLGPAAGFQLFRGGDCYLTPTSADGDAGDLGYGWFDPATHAVACTEWPMATEGRVIGWVPVSATTGTVRGEEAEWYHIWDHAGQGVPFADFCLCYEYTDNGAGLSWSFSLATGQSATFVHRTLFSADGIPPEVVPPPPGPVPVPYDPHWRPGAPFPETSREPEVRSDVAPVADMLALGHSCGNWEVLFDGSRATDRDGNIERWEWDFGDSTRASGPMVTHDYGRSGWFIVQLTVFDDRGHVDHDRRAILLPSCPRPEA